MKITEANNQLIVNNSSIGSKIVGGIFSIIGFGTIGSAIVQINGQELSKILPTVAFGVVFLGIGLYSLLLSKTRQIVLSKDVRSTAYSKRLLGGQTIEKQFTAADVAAVNVKHEATEKGVRGSNGDTRNQPIRTNTLSLSFKDGSTLELSTQSGTPGPQPGLMKPDGYNAEGQQIAAFLGVAFSQSDIGGPTGNDIIDVVNNVKIIGGMGDLLSDGRINLPPSLPGTVAPTVVTPAPAITPTAAPVEVPAVIPNVILPTQAPVTNAAQPEAPTSVK